jgi:hypothetical protein
MTPPGPGPIEGATAGLLEWLGQTAGRPAHLAAPGDTTAAAAQDGVALWPLELRPQRQTRSAGRREPFRFGVRYLVTATGPDALRLLDRVLTAAVTAGEPEISLEAGDPVLWQALGTAPRPALLVDVPAQVEHAPQTAPPVLHPLQIKHIARRTIAGLVVGPGDVPLAAMRVEVLGTAYATHTDAQGRFTVAGVPEATEVRLRLVGRGQILTAVVDPAEADLVIHCDLPTH